MYNMIQKMEKEQEDKRKAEMDQQRAERRTAGGYEQRDNRGKRGGDRGDRNDGGDRRYNNKKNHDRDNRNNRHEDDATKEDAEALGFKFNAAGPPRFQNSKK
jgi:hypothetical protein